MTAAQWNRLLAPYARPHHGRSLAQLALSLSMFAACLAAAAVARREHWAPGLALSAAAGLPLVKLFIIQHDCGHRNFFRGARACDWVGRGLSLLTLTPYWFWKCDHDRHHASSGDLDRRGSGDLVTLTVAEYRALPRLSRLRYRLYRHPAVLFGLGPAWQFLIRYRLPIGLGGARRGRMAASVLAHDAALAALGGGLCLVLGAASAALLLLPAVLVAATIGVWLFYVQHQFEGAYWRRGGEWSFVEAALEGSSYYRLPRWLHWLTGNIGYHHIHHLSCRIPNYNLPRAFAELPALRAAPSIGLRESLGCARLALWCETRRRLVSFRDGLRPAIG